MKSSYELAMERLAAKEGASKPLSDAQRAQLAELDEKYRAKIAEREIFLNQKLVEANAKGQFKDAEAIRKQLSSERVRLEEEREAAKERVRKG